MLWPIVFGIIGVLVLASIVFLVFVSLRPNSFRTQRSAVIKAPPERVFALLNDFHQWASWSPWEKMDPAMKRTHSGAPAGKGAVYEWEGNKNVGKGRMEMLESSPSKLVIKLDYLAPFEAHNTAEFTLMSQGDGTNVTWAMYGPHNFMMKLMHTLMDFDKMIGKDFEAGLANMKVAAER